MKLGAGIKVVVAGILAVCLFGAVFSGDVFAESAGGWIGSGSPSTGGNGGGGWAGGCSGAAAAYLLECQGYSWIFYRYVGGSNYPGDTPFRPDSSYNTISGECAEHGGAGGFWHFGWNMRALDYNGYGYFSNLAYVKGISSARVTYRTSVGGRGHGETFTPGMVRSGGVYSWANGYVKSDKDLDHTIYSDGKKAYEAYRYGSAGEVLEAYKQAYKAKYGEDYSGGAIPDDTYAFCWWPGIEDSGKSSFKGSSAIMKGNEDVTWPTAKEKVDTPWITKSGDKQTAELTTSCGAEGCDVTFRHYLRRVSGKGGTKYTISRQVVSGRPEVIGPNSLPITESVVSGSSFDNVKEVYPKGSNESNTGSTIRMYPGDKVCETMKFSTDGSNGYAESTVCATIEPEAETTDQVETFLNIGVVDESIKKYEGLYAPDAYAKPGDTVVFRVQYNPAPQQYTDCSNGSPWKNAYSVSATGFSYFKNSFYDCGDTTERFETNSYTIGLRQVGSNNILGETAVINPLDANGQRINTAIWTTPTKATISGENVDIGGEQLSSSARVFVPYNFNTGVQIDSDEEVVYAGESNDVSYRIDVVERQNELTTDDKEADAYKTLIRNPKIKTIVYYNAEEKGEFGSVKGEGDDEDSLCGYFGSDCTEDTKEYKNGDGDAILIDSASGKMTIDIPDIAAGNSVCAAVAIYPASSSKNENDNANLDAGGSQTWHISESKCFKVAKKPSFQVWGGNVYSGGNISAPLAKKTDLYGYSLNGKVQMFGSWAEWEVVHNGKNTWLASGAGLGYDRNDNGELWPAVQPEGWEGNNANIGDKGPGGRSGNAFCDVSVLTFPNRDCDNSTSGVLSGGGGSLNTNIEQIEGTIKNVQEGTEVSGGEIEGSVVYYSSDSMTITGDIKLKDDTVYTSLDDMPKVIIYADGSININPGVERIDAVLIAKSGDIDTCSIDKDNQSYSKDCSKQLSINGALIAGGSVYLNRTYGAATGANSMVPAEIINYNPALYLLDLGATSGTTSQSTIWEQVYTRELAPRY